MAEKGRIERVWPGVRPLLKAQKPFENSVNEKPVAREWLRERVIDFGMVEGMLFSSNHSLILYPSKTKLNQHSTRFLRVLSVFTQRKRF
jgi:glycerol-3-phosphate dehydrogenase